MTRAQRFTIASSLSRYRRPLWRQPYWPLLILVAFAAGAVAAIVTP